MKLHELPKIADKRKKVIGRGYGSGKGGHTVGKGTKGQKSRAGGKLRPLFEGGQNPLSRRIPRLKGFKMPQREVYEIIRLDKLNIFKDGTEVDASELFKTGLINGSGTPKVLDVGELKKKITLVNVVCSRSAEEKIKKQGGSIVWK
jgi:large subunit ribosomal protein L15